MIYKVTIEPAHVVVLDTTFPKLKAADASWTCHASWQHVCVQYIIQLLLQWEHKHTLVSLQVGQGSLVEYIYMYIYM